MRQFRPVTGTTAPAHSTVYFTIISGAKNAVSRGRRPVNGSEQHIGVIMNSSTPHSAIDNSYLSRSDEAKLIEGLLQLEDEAYARKRRIRNRRQRQANLQARRPDAAPQPGDNTVHVLGLRHGARNLRGNLECRRDHAGFSARLESRLFQRLNRPLRCHPVGLADEIFLNLANRGLR